jgi:HSP20 family protein
MYMLKYVTNRRRKTVSLLPFDPFASMTPLREAMNQLFEESFVGPRLDFFTGRVFPLDLYETEDKKFYIVEAALSGFKPEEIEITAEGDTLTIHAAKKMEEKKKEKGSYMRHERYEGEMMRSITLPGLIEPEKVEATYEHGILKLHIPKAEIVKPKQILVKVKEAVGAR